MQIFVGGLDASVSEDLLRETFYQYGELVHVKIPVGKGCGFVQFANRFVYSICSGVLHDINLKHFGLSCPVKEPY